MKTPDLKALVVVAVVDLATLVVGVLVYRRTPPRRPVYSVPSRGQLGETSGRVVDLARARCGPPSRPSTCFRAVVEFAAGGERYSLTGSTGHSVPPFRVGDAMPVLFRPEAPATAWLKDEYESILHFEKPRGLSPRGAVLAVVLSVAVPTTLGVLLLAVARHQASRERPRTE